MKLAGGADPSASLYSEISPIKIRVNSNLVVVPVTVTDGKGRVISGLRKEHFAVYEDTVEQAITHFAAEDAPVSIGLVLDTSDSMTPRLQKAREAITALLNTANPSDEVSLIQFNDRAQLLVGFTTRTEEIRDHIAMVHARGATALLDAVSVALSEMRNARYTRKAIIIISDGEDNSSHYSVAELKQAVREADVLIYAIGLGDSSQYSQDYQARRLIGAALLDEITKQTGGCLFQVDRMKQLPGIATKISAWLRSEYVLGYVPSADDRAGYRRIQVKITKPSGYPKLHAFWRLGYYTPAR